MMIDRTAEADDYFVVPGTIRISSSALAFAREFARQTRALADARNLILTFGYSFERTLRKGPGAPIIDLGPGFDLGLHDRSKVPDRTVHRDGDLEFAIQVPPWIYEASRDRTIDFEDIAPPKLVLR